MAPRVAWAAVEGNHDVTPTDVEVHVERIAEWDSDLVVSAELHTRDKDAPKLAAGSAASAGPIGSGRPPLDLPGRGAQRGHSSGQMAGASSAT
eukprot:651225-Lingulodinium_polyedra.AAC.1